MESRLVLRPMLQRAVLIAGFGGFALISIAMLADAGEAHPFTIVMYSVLLLLSVIAVWRSARIGVVADGEGLRLRQLAKGVYVTKEKVTGVSCEERPGAFLTRVYEPVIHTADGRTQPLTALANYSRSTAERRTQRLREWSQGAIG